MSTLLVALSKKKDGIKVTLIKKGNVREVWDKRYATFEDAGTAVSLWMGEHNEELEKSAERKKKAKKEQIPDAAKEEKAKPKNKKR